MEFEEIITEGQQRLNEACGDLPRSYTEELLDLVKAKPIKIVTGFRRAGKSTIVREACRRLIKSKKYSLRNILYLNFEDLKLAKYLQATEVKKIIDLFLTQYRGKKLLVFDEIQLVQDWDKLLRTLYEFGKDINIVITGSNSDLLSSELSSRLAGRFVAMEVQPFSFKEFLLYRGISIESKKELSRHEDEIKDHFYQYIRFGGLPETFSITSDDAKRSYLEGLISKVILDDVIERFNVRNPSLIEKILSYILVNIGKVVSFVKIANHLKQLDRSTKQGTIINYVDYLSKTFAISELQRFSWKSQRVFDSSKKYYAADVALSYLYHDLSNNFSHRLENLVYQKLRRDKQFSSIYYGYDDQEIDFISLDRKNNLFEKYQVCKELTEDNRDREFGSLVYSDAYTKNSENFLLSLEDRSELVEELIPSASVQIKQENLIEWLLDL